MGSKFPFEVAVGMNGRVWVKGQGGAEGEEGELEEMERMVEVIREIKG